MLGGVHRLADFELVSKQAPSNLWDHAAGYHIVTGRELLGLRLFGYKLTEKDGRVIYSCAGNPEPAKNATLEAYSEYMKKKGVDSITSLIREMVPGMNNEIQTFDRGKLNHVKPPR